MVRTRRARRDLSIVVAAAGASLTLLRCSSFESDPATPSVEQEAGADGQPVVEAGPGPADGGADSDPDACLGTFEDDFNRSTISGDPWNDLIDQLGDAGEAALLPYAGGGNAFGIHLFPGVSHDRGMALLKEIPEGATSVELTYDQILVVSGYAGAIWAAGFVQVQVGEPGDASVSMGSSMLNGVGLLGWERSLADGGTESDGIPAPLSFQGDPQPVRITVWFGPTGKIEMQRAGNLTAAALPTTPVGKGSVALGLFASGPAPEIGTQYAKVRGCWR